MAATKVLALMGSPRKRGNTDLLIDQVVRGAREAGATAEKLILNDLSIRHCQACDGCRRKPRCVTNDDMLPLYDKVLESSVIVFGTPVYWYGPSAQLKAFLDRWHALTTPDNLARLRHKKGVLVCCYEEPEPVTAEDLVGMMDKTFRHVGMVWGGKLLVSAGKRGEVVGNAEAMNEAYQLGCRLPGSASRQEDELNGTL